MTSVRGDATLLELPDAAKSVDAGCENNASFDVEEALTGYLDGFFLQYPAPGNRLLSLINTHPHMDQVRGIAAALEKYPPEHMVTDGQASSSGKRQQRRLHRYVEGHPNDPTDDKPLVR